MSKGWFCQECLVKMDYKIKDGFFKCPECMTEVWPPSGYKLDDEILDLMIDKQRNHIPKECKPAGEALLGSGSSSKSRSKKAEMKKKTLSQINAGLNGKCQSFDS